MGKFNFNGCKDFNEVKIAAEKQYERTGELYCPYFNDKVIFNAKGLRHLKFKSDKKARSHKDQYSRLKLIKYIPEVIERSHTLQGIWEIRKFESQKTNSRWEEVYKIKSNSKTSPGRC